MRITNPTALSVIAVALVLPACGADSVDPVADPPESSDPTTTTLDPSSGQRYEYPSGADDVVMSIEQVGGFAPIEAIAGQLPSFVVSGDARQFTLGPRAAIFPGPLLPNVQVADIGAARVQDLLALADEHGLLQDREYDAPVDVADASTTVVTVRVGGDTFVHRAYALGIGIGESGDSTGDAAREQLQDFIGEVAAMAEPDSVAFEPDSYLVHTFEVDDLGVFEIEPTVLPWPGSLDVDLFGAECVEIAADAVSDLFTDADELTFFEQDGVVYRSVVKPAMPGVDC